MNAMQPSRPQLILASIGALFFITLILGEYTIAKRKNLLEKIYKSSDTLANLWILIIRIAINSLVAGGILAAIFNTIYKYNLHLTDRLNTLIYWTILIIGEDFCYYWFHRYSHEIRWGWASHIVHHSSNYLNYTTAIRESITYVLSGVFVFWLPLVFIGYKPTDVLIAIAIGLVYQFYLHTTLIAKLGFVIEYVFNTPSHHRVHHARNPQYINQNYAAIFILWDRWFGTFTEETETPDYGLVHQVYNYNPIYILFQGWYDMLALAIQRRNLKYLLFFPKN